MPEPKDDGKKSYVNIMVFIIHASSAYNWLITRDNDSKDCSRESETNKKRMKTKKCQWNVNGNTPCWLTEWDTLCSGCVLFFIRNRKPTCSNRIKSIFLNAIHNIIYNRKWSYNIANAQVVTITRAHAHTRSQQFTFQGGKEKITELKKLLDFSFIFSFKISLQATNYCNNFNFFPSSVFESFFMYTHLVSFQFVPNAWLFCNRSNRESDLRIGKKMKKKNEKKRKKSFTKIVGINDKQIR